MLESTKSSKFVSHRVRMSGEFDSRIDSHSTKFERKPWIFEKLSFRNLSDYKLSGLHPYDVMVKIHWVKNRLKTERHAVSSWDMNARVLWLYSIHNHLLIFKISSSFEYFCPNFQIFCPFLTLLSIFCPFSEKSQSHTHFLE